MKKNHPLHVFLFILTLFFFFVYSVKDVHAADSAEVAQDVAVSHAQTQWELFGKKIEDTEISHITGTKSTISIPTGIYLDDVRSMEYAFTGDVTYSIRYVASTDPNTVEVNKVNDSTIELIRGYGENKTVGLQIGYKIHYSFKVWENVLGIWYPVNDRYGTYETFMNANLSVDTKFFATAKTDNVLEINQSIATTSPDKYVILSGDTTGVTSKWTIRPDVSKLGKAFGVANFANSIRSQVVPIDFIVQDTTPPTGTAVSTYGLEAGTSLDLEKLFIQYDDNSKLPVQLTAVNPIDFPNERLGTFPYAIRLTDTSGNFTEVATTVVHKDTTPPKLTAKKVLLELGNSAKPEMFADATDNYKFATYTWAFANSTPDFTKLGKQTVHVQAVDQSGNIGKIDTELTVQDTLAPTATAIPQLIELGNSLPADPAALLKDVKDNDELKNLRFRYVDIGDVSVVGFSEAKIEVEDSSGNTRVITVPVFTKDQDTTILGNSAIYAKNFEIWQDELSKLSEAEITSLIHTQSQIKGWDILTGKDLTSAITIKQTELTSKSPAGIYESVLELQTNQKTIQTKVKNPSDLISIRLPTSLTFGVSDVSEQGKILSPTYQITNKSYAPVKISLANYKNFTTNELELLDAATPDPMTITPAARLNLQLWTKSEKVELASLTDHTPVTAIGQLAYSESYSLKFTGNYFGDFQKERLPNHSLVLKFEAIK